MNEEAIGSDYEHKAVPTAFGQILTRRNNVKRFVDSASTAVSDHCVSAFCGKTLIDVLVLA